MKYYIIAGEPSGDLHGSNLMKAILALDPNAEFQYWGGDQMQAVKSGLVTHIRETSIMGFVEVAKNIRKIYSFFEKAKKSIKTYEPDHLILIDYPGFNLRMAKWAKRQGLHVSYYISPQLWAWKKGRIKTVKSSVDKMIVIIPFEKQFYHDHGVDADYVGHPLLPVIQNFKADPDFKSKHGINKHFIALLPGSRKQEISKLLPVYLEAVKVYNMEFQVVLAAAPHIEKEFYTNLISESNEEIIIVENDTYNILHNASFAVVTSGTATLETAMFKVPQVVCYKTSSVNYEIGKRLVDLENISLVNLILGETVVPELIQQEASPEQIEKMLRQLMKDKVNIVEAYDKLEVMLTQEEDPSLLAAQVILG